MAKSRRGRGQKASRKVDWVVNDETYGSVISLPNAAQVLLVLALPRFVTNYRDVNNINNIPGYQFPEQENGQVAYAVRGSMSINPGTWAAGTVLRLMLRLVKKPLDYNNVAMQAIVDPAYSLFTPEFANERFLWQHYLRESFNFGSPFFEIVPIAWKGVCKLEPDEGLFLAVENQSGITQTVVLNPFLRTLMRADG